MKLKIFQLITVVLMVILPVMVPLVSVAAADGLQKDFNGSDPTLWAVAPNATGNTGEFERHLNEETISGKMTATTNITPTTKAIPTSTVKQYVITAPPEITNTTQPDAELEYIEIVMPDGSVTIIACDAGNRVVRDYKISGISGLMTFTFYTGTKIITPDGDSPSRIVTTEILGKNTSGYAIRVYEVKVLDGNGSLTSADLNPPVLMTFRYLPDELPDNATGAYVALYEEVTDTWDRLESFSGYTTQDGELAVQIAHLSVFGIFADFTPLPSAGGLSTATIVWIIIGGLFVIFLLVLFYVVIRRRYKKADKE